MTYLIRPATPADAKRIAPLLRAQDKLEVKAASGRTPEAALASAFDRQGHHTIFAETLHGDPILIGGVSPMAPNVGCIWMLATPLLELHAKSFIREGRKQIAAWHQTYPALCNRTWAENDLHVRFLRFMGFSLLNRVLIKGVPFIEFARHQSVRSNRNI